MSERYERQIRRDRRRLVRYAINVVDAQIKGEVENMSLKKRVRLAFNIIFKKRYETEKEC